MCGIGINMKIIATLECQECGKTWDISKDLRDLESDDLKHCGRYAEIIKYYRGEDNDTSQPI